MSTPPPEYSLTARGVIVCAVLFLCPLVFSFSFTTFLYPKEIVLAAGLLALSVIGLIDRAPVSVGFSAYRPLLLGLGGVVVLQTLPFPARDWTQVLEDGAYFGTALLFAVLAYPLWRVRTWRYRAGSALVASAAAVAALGLLQYAGLAARVLPVFPDYDQRMYSVFGNQDLLGGYLAIALPIIVHGLLRRERHNPLLWAVLLPVLLTLMLSGSRTAWLAAAVGSLIMVPGRSGHPPWHRLAGAVAAMGIVASLINASATWGRVWATFGEHDIGGKARLWFWDGTIRMIADAPLLGVGLGNYAYWSPRYLGSALAAPDGTSHLHNPIHTLHAHSEVLEFFAETGLIGLLFFVWWLYTLRQARGPAWGTMLALAVFACFNAALHSVPHLLAGLLLAGILTSTPRHVAAPRATAWTRVALPIAAIGLIAFQAWALWIPDRRLKRAEDLHLANADPLPRYAAALGGRDPESVWHSGELLMEYGLALIEADRHEDARRFLDAAQSRLDTGELYLLLGECALADGDEESAKAYLRKCLYRWPANERAFRQLYAVADSAERTRLNTHAARWEIQPPQPAD